MLEPEYCRHYIPNLTETKRQMRKEAFQRQLTFGTFGTEFPVLEQHHWLDIKDFGLYVRKDKLKEIIELVKEFDQKEREEEKELGSYSIVLAEKYPDFPVTTYDRIRSLHAYRSDLLEWRSGARPNLSWWDTCLPGYDEIPLLQWVRRRGRRSIFLVNTF